MPRDRTHDLGWRYWAATAVLLLGGDVGAPAAWALVPVLTAVQLLHIGWRHRRIAAFPVQVRLAYLGLSVLALADPTHLLFAALTAGTLALVLFDYCPLARLLSLLPWNRRQPLSWALLRHTVMAAPTRGSFIDARTPPATDSAR